MLNLFDNIATVTTILSSLLAILLIIKYYTLNSSLKLVAVYLIGSAAIDIVSSAFFEIQESNLKFLHLFALFEIIVISKIFQLSYWNFKSHLKIEFIGIPVALFVILNTIFLQDLTIYNTYSLALVSIVILGYCIYYFFLLLDFNDSNFEFIVLKWFIYTLFFYHSISLIIMFLGNLLKTIDTESQVYIWLFRVFIILASKVILIFYFSKLFLKSSKLSIDE